MIPWRYGTIMQSTTVPWDRATKKAELEAAQENLQRHRNSMRSGDTAANGVSGAKVKMRSLLRCDQCDHLEAGVCDACRAIFASEEWVAMHPDWQSRQEEESQHATLK